MRFERPDWIPRLLVLSLLASGLWACSDDSPSEPDPYAPALQSALNDAVRALDLFGATAAVIAPGRDLWTSASGFSQPATLTPMRADHLLGVGGVTMNFVAALTLKLVEDGTLILDAPISTYIPTLNNVDPTATVRQLLNHTAGVHDFGTNPSFLPAIFAQPDRAWTSLETLSYVQAPPFAPGAEFGFSNSNYVVLGRIIEAVTGGSVVDLLRGRILVPQTLTRTSMAGFEPVNGETPHAFFDLDGNSQLDDVTSMPRTALMTAVGAAGAIFTTAEELARWADALYHGRVLSGAALTEMVDHVSVGGGLPIGQTGYGLGSSEWTIRLQQYLGHNGDTVGFGAVVLYSVEDDITAAVLTNQPGAGALVDVAADLILTAALNR